MSIEDIYKTISEYDIDEENVLDFIFQGNQGDSSKLYYRCMLLQLLHHVEHFDNIIDLYYRTESRQPFEGATLSYNINDDGKTKKKYYKDTIEESDEKKLAIYAGFERGNCEEFQKIIEWATTIVKELEGIKRGDARLEEPISDFMNYKEWEHEIEDYINSNKEEIEDEEKCKLLKRSYEIEIPYIKQKEDESLKILEGTFHSLGLNTLWDECISRYRYYNEEMMMEGILFWDERALYKIKQYFALFKKDLYGCSKIIQNQSNVLTVIKSGASLEEVCNRIRVEINRYNPDIDVGLRDKKIYGGFNGFITHNSSYPEDLPEAYKELSEEYNKVMKEQDREKFIRLCTDFNFDFVKVHPFTDGNGRTSRILLSSMLASRDIFFPSLYTDPREKYEFLKRSNSVLEHNNYLY